MEAKRHWESIYETKSVTDVSWYQREATVSLQLIREATSDLSAAIIDVGGGASTLVDSLLALRYRNVTVLDIASNALANARARLGKNAERVRWISRDVLETGLPDHSIDVWHDRAVFHFLLTPEERHRYVAEVRRVVRPDGHVIVATFAEDGPTRCSGLPVARYDAEALHTEFGADFEMIETMREEHVTPSGAIQAFRYCVCRLAPVAVLA